MGTGDLFTAAAILALAAWILYRSLFRKQGGCHGCSGCSHGGGSDLVRLGARSSRNPGGALRDAGRPPP
jgi:attachment p12 family protein